MSYSDDLISESIRGPSTKQGSSKLRVLLTSASPAVMRFGLSGHRYRKLVSLNIFRMTHKCCMSDWGSVLSDGKANIFRQNKISRAR